MFGMHAVAMSCVRTAAVQVHSPPHPHRQQGCKHTGPYRTTGIPEHLVWKLPFFLVIFDADSVLLLSKLDEQMHLPST